MSGDSAMGGGPPSDILKAVQETGAAFFDVETPRLMGRVIAAAEFDLAKDLAGPRSHQRRSCGDGRPMLRYDGRRRGGRARGW